VASQQAGQPVGAAGGQLRRGRGCGLLLDRGRPLVQPGADVVGRVGTALPLVAGDDHPTGRDTRETGKSEQLPEAHGP
jgi:hypothetical protein